MDFAMSPQSRAIQVVDLLCKVGYDDASHAGRRVESRYVVYDGSDVSVAS
jgi:hypothetical protein